MRIGHRRIRPIVRIHRTRADGAVTEEVPAPPPAHEGHAWIVAEFLDWLDGGPTPATTLEDNIRTAATIFGAIEAARTGSPWTSSRWSASCPPTKGEWHRQEQRSVARHRLG